MFSTSSLASSTSRGSTACMFSARSLASSTSTGSTACVFSTKSLAAEQEMGWFGVKRVELRERIAAKACTSSTSTAQRLGSTAERPSKHRIYVGVKSETCAVHLDPSR